MWILYQIELQMLELGLMFQIKIIGQKIKIIGLKKQNYLEDRLSDRLHEELTKTFIDKRASVLARGLKQDMEFKTKILENNDVLIDDQFIGKINGLKLELDLKKGALETDIKSLKKSCETNHWARIRKKNSN